MGHGKTNQDAEKGQAQGKTQVEAQEHYFRTQIFNWDTLGTVPVTLVLVRAFVFIELRILALSRALYLAYLDKIVDLISLWFQPIT